MSEPQRSLRGPAEPEPCRALPASQGTHHEGVLLRRPGRELGLALSDAQEHWAGADPWKRLPHFTDDPGSRKAARLCQEVPAAPCAELGSFFFFFLFSLSPL